MQAGGVFLKHSGGGSTRRPATPADVEGNVRSAGSARQRVLIKICCGPHVRCGAGSPRPPPAPPDGAGQAGQAGRGKRPRSFSHTWSKREEAWEYVEVWVVWSRHMARGAPPRLAPLTFGSAASVFRAAAATCVASAAVPFSASRGDHSKAWGGAVQSGKMAVLAQRLGITILPPVAVTRLDPTQTGRVSESGKYSRVRHRDVVSLPPTCSVTLARSTSTARLSAYSSVSAACTSVSVDSCSTQHMGGGRLSKTSRFAQGEGEGRNAETPRQRSALSLSAHR